MITWYVESKENFANMYRSDIPLTFDEGIIRSVVERIEAETQDKSAFAAIHALPTTPPLAAGATHVAPEEAQPAAAGQADEQVMEVA